MSVEAATFVADLQPVNPPATDPRAQGDDHLRLIKQVLQNTFSGASRQWQIPGTKLLSTSYSIVKSDGESVLYTSTAGGAVTLTLPGLVAADAGWKVRFIKTSGDANPMFIVPPSGTLNSGGIAGLTRARRCIPGVQITAIWDGANWFVTRAGAAPIGTLLDFAGSFLPAGFEWPNGQTLSSSTNYPEYNAVMGGLLLIDMRGRVAVTLDNLGGSAAGRLPSGVINGNAIGNSGGQDAVTLTMASVPQHQHAVFLKENPHTHATSPASPIVATSGASVAGPGVPAGVGTATLTITSALTGITIGSVSGVANDNQTANAGAASPTPLSNCQPSIVCSKILVVE